MKRNKARPPKAKSNAEFVALLGVGLDGDDGHTRLTRGEEFVLFGGSADTHGRMQETMIKVVERLERRGRRMADAAPDELRDLLHEASDGISPE
ncbi:MAG: hypothetical protein K2Y37_11310 [Pirellulales bacterium]|nr:hypothetical protein [Pirellulales bacterium]